MFYQNVVAYCEENNLSIHAFEKKCGLGNGVVGRWKDNNSLPALTTCLLYTSPSPRDA